jgi:hypothetical protein
MWPDGFIDVRISSILGLDTVVGRTLASRAFAE